MVSAVLDLILLTIGYSSLSDYLLWYFKSLFILAVYLISLFFFDVENYHQTEMAIALINIKLGIDFIA